SGLHRYLIAQKRGRWSFTDTIREVKAWARADDPVGSPYGHLVHQRLVEDAANGTAVIDTLKDKIPGIKAITPRGPKEMRARAVTPEIESGHVALPYPMDSGNGWV